MPESYKITLLSLSLQSLYFIYAAMTQNLSKKMNIFAKKILLVLFTLTELY